MISYRNFPKVSACTVVNPRSRPACGAGAVLAKDQSFVSRLGNLLFNSQTTQTWVWLEKGASMDLQRTHKWFVICSSQPARSWRLAYSKLYCSGYMWLQYTQLDPNHGANLFSIIQFQSHTQLRQQLRTKLFWCLFAWSVLALYHLKNLGFLSHHIWLSNPIASHYHPVRSHCMNPFCWWFLGIKVKNSKPHLRQAGHCTMAATPCQKNILDFHPELPGEQPTDLSSKWLETKGEIGVTPTWAERLIMESPRPKNGSCF